MKTYQKICQHCGADYTTRKSTQKYCCLGCAHKKQIGKRKLNKITILNDCAIINIESKKHGSHEFIIDLEDVDKVKNCTWNLTYSVRKNFYAYTKINNVNIKLHRLILNATEGKLVDHIDRNPRNNRKSNLRLCSALENSRNVGIRNTNTTGYKNISYYKQRNKYVFQIIRQDLHHQKRFNTLEEALKARELFFKNNPQYTLVE